MLNDLAEAMKASDGKKEDLPDRMPEDMPEGQIDATRHANSQTARRYVRKNVIGHARKNVLNATRCAG